MKRVVSMVLLSFLVLAETTIAAKQMSSDVFNKTSQDDVVIVCSRGRSGASNTYDHLTAQGIDEKRLLILEGGMQGWPIRRSW